MVRKLPITVDEEVYTGLRERVGPRRISRFLNDLAKPLVTQDALLAGYREMTADRAREAEALEWSEALIGDLVLDGD